LKIVTLGALPKPLEKVYLALSCHGEEVRITITKLSYLLEKPTAEKRSEVQPPRESRDELQAVKGKKFREAEKRIEGRDREDRRGTAGADGPYIHPATVMEDSNLKGVPENRQRKPKQFYY